MLSLAVFPPKTVIGHFSTVAVALGGLTIWHAVLISRGETSIERHLNNKETKRMRKCGKVHAHTHTHTPCSLGKGLAHYHREMDKGLTIKRAKGSEREQEVG